MEHISHTPGPWFVSVRPQQEVAVVTSAGEEVYVGHLYEREHEANARLIAAAPELLEAAQFAEKRIHASGGDVDAMLALRAAIARATEGNDNV